MHLFDRLSYYTILYNLYSIIRMKKTSLNCVVGESNRIRTVPEYGHSRYLRNHKSYKKNLMNNIFIII